MGETHGYLYRYRRLRIGALPSYIPLPAVIHTQCLGAAYPQLMSNVHVQWTRRTPQPHCLATTPSCESGRSRDLTRAREDGRRRSGPGLAASTSTRTARNMGASLCAPHAACVADRVGRAPQDAERCLRDGRGVQDAEGAGGHRCSDTGRRGRGRRRRRVDQRRACIYVCESGRLPHVECQRKPHDRICEQHGGHDPNYPDLY